jgi:DNA-binding NtrC family response regulator
MSHYKKGWNMRDGSSAATQSQTVMVIRPSHRVDPACTHAKDLASRGIDLNECTTLAAIHAGQQSGCKVGLLILRRESDFSLLRTCASWVVIGTMSWIGLIARELIMLTPVRQFIGENLFNFIVTPADPDDIALAIRHAWGMALMQQTLHAVPASIPIDSMIVGNTTRMQLLFEQIKKVARTDACILIKGQSGTGKELVARSIHLQSSRKDGPFIAVNCGAIAQQLFQSELFGHEKGAFTGAHQRKIGRIEAAQGGTLLLDEIGDMPFDMQVNLLRFLQEKTIERVGGTTSRPIDVHVIAATHVDLAEAVRQDRFREDLYYRIDVVSITLPTLAERGSDIEALALHYLAQFSAGHKRRLRGFSSAAMEALLSHPWPGNVRELVNRVQRAVVMADGRFISPEDLGFEQSGEPEPTMSLEQARATAEQHAIKRALMQARNRMSRAATLLGISRVTLYRLVDKYQIRTDIEQDTPCQHRAGPGQIANNDARTNMEI